MSRKRSIRVDVERVLHDVRYIWGDVDANLLADGVVVVKLGQLPPDGLPLLVFCFHGSIAAFVLGFNREERGQWSEMVALVSAIFAFLMKCCGAEVAM